MGKFYPSELSGVSDGLQQGKADGRLRNAGLRVDRNTIVIDGATITATTADTFSLGMAKSGQRTRGFVINSNGVNMATASIAIGTAADPTKYMPATALPNATAQRYDVLAPANGYDPIEAEEELIVTISVATIPNGTLSIDREFTQR